MDDPVCPSCGAPLEKECRFYYRCPKCYGKFPVERIMLFHSLKKTKEASEED